MRLFIVCLFWAFAAAAASAAPITFQFTADWQRSSGTLTDSAILNLPSAISGSLTFDDATPDNRSDRDDFGSYIDTGVITIDGADFGPISSRNVTVGDDFTADVYDRFTVFTRYDNRIEILLNLQDTTASAFTSDGLPGSLDLSLFDVTAFQVRQLTDRGTIAGYAGFELTSLTSAAVPLPASTPLMLLWLALLGGLHFKSKRPEFTTL